jgi:hypothetical protein
MRSLCQILRLAIQIADTQASSVVRAGFDLWFRTTTDSPLV